MTQGPAATVDEVRNLLSDQKTDPTEITKDSVEDKGDTKEGEESVTKVQEPRTLDQSKTNGDVATAEVAAEVADSAEKLDKEV